MPSNSARRVRPPARLIASCLVMPHCSRLNFFVVIRVYPYAQSVKIA